MPSALGLAGHQQDYQHTAHVANHLVLAMRSAAQRVPCLPFDTTPSETSLHNFSRCGFERLCRTHSPAIDRRDIPSQKHKY